MPKTPRKRVGPSGPITARFTLPAVPATFFGMVLGLGGLGNGWRMAAQVWGLPVSIGEALSITAATVWLVLLVLYALKWVTSREEAIAELQHQVQALFIALVPVATLMASLAVAPYLPDIAWLMLVIGIASQVAFSAWAVGELWQGGRDAEATTPALYMPTVGGCFVSAIACGSFGYPEMGLLFFGAGFLSLVVLESVVLHRLLTHALPVRLRATMGLHLATPAVGCVAYLSVTDGPPDRFVQMLFGYALLQALIMLRLVPWLREQAFSPAAWAYTFGVSALPLAALSFIERGQAGPIDGLALPLFIGANLIIGWITVRTLALAFAGQLVRPEPSRKSTVP
ncbi:dicarboxylate transporter/tellurite-resistance protein TehA [Microvirga massiliensis]|uniref:dicarboxylate transporter/tellurite-resistance protein TehA n=1 Tax=Microvirga massiliensis TaxID=1033741 RepID=UPI0009E49E0F|nr:dicarboxylate transporter/tellurite-resistance protein TehA [Microvirga massiliensis]